MDAASSPGGGENRISSPSPAVASAWTIDFGAPKVRRKTTAKERAALRESRLRSVAREPPAVSAEQTKISNGGDADHDGVRRGEHALPVVYVEEALDDADVIPTNLTTVRADLEKRLVLRLPRLLCISKQYPRSCGITSLASVYNYLYSCLGESDVGAGRPPISQEEVMSLLNFEPPYGSIAWGSFTGNATLMRWFHALNRHFGLRGRATVLYKAHGKGSTRDRYSSSAEVLEAVKAALRNPSCAIIYHCYNHYMVPIGYQDIPRLQRDFLKPVVPPADCETTLFIGEVSRGRHEAIYARRWQQVVQDIECSLPQFVNIRRPELGVQTREGRRPKKQVATSAPAESPGVLAASAPTDDKEQLQQQDANRSASGARVADTAQPEEDTPPTASTRGAPPLVRRCGGRNLHCLLLFRNDEVEEHPERFEDDCPSERSASEAYEPDAGGGDFIDSDEDA